MSTISASTTSTTAYKVTADTTGTLVLQTGSTPTTAVTIDTSQNVGIGTTSPSFASGSGLAVYGASAARLALKSNATGANNGLQMGIDSSGLAFIEQRENNALLFATNATERMRLDASGRLGIGLTNPVDTLQVNGGITVGSDTNLDNRSRFYESFGLTIDAGVTNGRAILFRTQGAERARIDSSGNLLVGTTSVASNAKVTVSFSGGSASSRGIVMVSGSTANTAMIGFQNPNGYAQGEILTSGTTTTYSTSSDYRLKENIAPMTGALAKVALLKPCTYKWKVDGSNGDGFIAHELQEVVPQCVTNEKDAVDEDGNPIYQGIDTSFLVATLTAAIQEQQAIIETLTNRITALEGAA